MSAYLNGKKVDVVFTDNANIEAIEQRLVEATQELVEEASQSAEEAEQSATQASNSASEASTSENNAKTYAEEAEKHEANASEHASSAEKSQKAIEDWRAYESHLSWGGKNLVNDISPVDASFIPYTYANRFALMPESYIVWERSSDGGKTWNVPTDDIEKDTKILNVTTKGGIAVLPSGSTNKSVNNQLRVTFTIPKGSLYIKLKKLIIDFGTGTATGCKCVVSVAKYSSPDTFTEYLEENLDGNSWYNVLQFDDMLLGDYANSTATSHVNRLRLTFSCTGLGARSNNFLVSSIYAFTPYAYNTLNLMQKYGSMYEPTWKGVAKFSTPVEAETIKAKTFVGYLNGTADWAGTAEYAFRASCDDNDQTISDTYEKKTDANNKRSNALKGNANAVNALRVDGVSPIEHEMSVRVRSKNLIDSPFGLINVENGKTYTLSIALKEGVELSVNKEYGLWWYTQSGDLANASLVQGGVIFSNPFVFVAGLDGDYGYYIDTNMTEDEIEYVQLEEGTKATPYTPFVDVSGVKVKRYSRNIFDIDKGLNKCLVKNEDGTYTITKFDNNYRFSASIPFDFPTNKVDVTDKVFVFSMCAEIVDTNIESLKGVSLIFYGKDKTQSFTGSLKENYGSYTTSSFERINSALVFIGNEQADGAYITFKNPQIAITYYPDYVLDYEPFVEPIECTVNADGTVNGLTSISPTTTLITDNGVVIEVEYNKDINEAYKSQQSKIAELETMILELTTKLPTN